MEYHKQRFVAFAEKNGRIQKRSGKSLITPQMKLGKTEDEILNKIITELQYSFSEYSNNYLNHKKH